MNWREAPATAVLTLVTLAISALITLAGITAQAAISLGFIPVIASGAIMPAEAGFTLPWWLTPLSATLVHAGFIHLALNLVMLAYCGYLVERAIGPRALILLYIIGGYAACAAQWAWEPESPVPMIGASGAISALVAAYALFFGNLRAKAVGPIPATVIHALWLAAAWVGVQLLIGLAGLGRSAQIAIGAHIGGFLAGLLLARPLLLWRYRGA